VYFEKFKRPLQFMFYGFLLLSCAPFCAHTTATLTKSGRVIAEQKR